MLKSVRTAFNLTFAIPTIIGVIVCPLTLNSRQRLFATGLILLLRVITTTTPESVGGGEDDLIDGIHIFCYVDRAVLMAQSFDRRKNSSRVEIPVRKSTGKGRRRRQGKSQPIC